MTQPTLSLKPRCVHRGVTERSHLPKLVTWAGCPHTRKFSHRCRKIVLMSSCSISNAPGKRRWRSQGSRTTCRKLAVQKTAATWDLVTSQAAGLDFRSLLDWKWDPKLLHVLSATVCAPSSFWTCSLISASLEKRSRSHWEHRERHNKRSLCYGDNDGISINKAKVVVNPSDRYIHIS